MDITYYILNILENIKYHPFSINLMQTRDNILKLLTTNTIKLLNKN